MYRCPSRSDAGYHPRDGTDEQKREHLPRIARAEVKWCQGFSEPGAGSDLASLQTRAVRDGDDFDINGQTIWTSGAHEAGWIHVLARTDPDAPKHRGISHWMQGQGLMPNHEASMSKMYNSDVGRRMTRCAVNLFGLAGQLRASDPRAPIGGMPAFRYLDTVRLTIGQGTG